MITYAHSGAMGDIIYSLPVIKHFGPGTLYIKLHANEHVARRFGYDGPVPEYHKNRLTEVDYEMIRPLLEVQTYIGQVGWTEDKDMQATYDLDNFRGVLFRTFRGNYLEGYFKTFNIPYTEEDIIKPWLFAVPKRIAPIVVSRSFRYRNKLSLDRWHRYVSLPNFDNNSIFIGLLEEYQDFCKEFNTKLPYCQCKDFLEMAEVIAGCDMFIGNQTFAYSLAQGLGKSTSLEIIDDRPLLLNECYFKREDCTYF